MEQKKQKEALSKVLILAKKKYIQAMESKEKEEILNIENLLNDLD